jgi:phosphinothricin acetyltransferase
VTSATVRAVDADDAGAIARIYNQGIEDRVATFETARHHAADIEPWIARSDRFPLIVAEREGEIVGWAAVLPYSDRCAYKGVGEYTIYVERSARGGGIGAVLLEGLLAAAQERGFWKLIGRLFTTNAPTIALARSHAFSEVGTHRRHGRLDGEWRDVLLVERLIGDAASD